MGNIFTTVQHVWTSWVRTGFVLFHVAGPIAARRNATTYREVPQRTETFARAGVSHASLAVAIVG